MSNARIARELLGLARELAAGNIVSEAQKLQRKLVKQFESEFRRRPSENMGDKYLDKFDEFIGGLYSYGYSDRLKIQKLRKELFDIVTGVPTVASERLAYGRFKWQRTQFIPTQAKGADNIRKAVIPDNLDLEIYTYEQSGSLYGVAFQGHAQKPLWNYRFRDEAQRDRQIQETIQSRQKHLERKLEEQKKRQEFTHDYKVGDILYSSWGYDQTNIDFYEVVGVTQKAIKVREIGQKVVKSDRGADYVVAVLGSFKGAPMTKRVRPGGSVRIESFASASKWDGKPKYQTAAGWGH